MFEVIEISGIALLVFFLFYRIYWVNIKNEVILLEEKVIEKVTEKYEDKYLEKYKKFTKDLYFTEDDLKHKAEKRELLKSAIKETIDSDIYEIDKVEDELDKYMQELYFSRLKNSYLFEYTPIGNIAMCYNNEKKSFEYYSDKMMPYRYLETVARKYVMFFYCKILYVDMENEIKIAENKLAENKLAENKLAENKVIKQPVKIQEVKTRDIFVRLKNYNTEKPISNRNMSNRNNSNKKPVIQTNENYILKENANRYTHNGKFVNFDMLKKEKIDKTELSYKDYVEMIKNIKFK